MSYASDHLAWQQRVSQERTAAHKFMEHNRFFQTPEDYQSFLMMSNPQQSYRGQAPLFSPQNKGGSQSRNMFKGEPNYNRTIQTPRITSNGQNKQSYTFGGQKPISQSPMYENTQRVSIVNPEDIQDSPNFLAKQAYVKKKRSTAAQSTRSSRVSKTFKTFYPPNYDKDNHHMEKLPRIQRFNEEFDTLSTVSKQKQQVDDKKDLQTLLQKNKTQTIMLNQIIKNNHQENLMKAENDLNLQQNVNGAKANEDEQEEKSELYDDINSLYNMENPRGEEDDKKSTISHSTKAKSTISMRSQVIISKLERQLQEERDARIKLQEELESIKQLSLQLLKNSQLSQNKH